MSEEKNIYKFDYIQIRRTNLNNWFDKYYKTKWFNACKFNANHNRGVAPKIVEAKDWTPNDADVNFANETYGKLEDWNVTNEKKFEFIKIYKQFNETVNKNDYAKAADELCQWYDTNMKQNDLFRWDDKLNYSGKEYENHEIFVDLFYRDEKGKPTLRYNVLDDSVTLNDVPFRDIDLKKDIVDNAGKLFKVVKDDIKDVYNMDIRWEYKNVYAYDVLKEYLDNLPIWDGVERAETWFIKYQYAPDCNYVRHATLYWLINAIRSIYEPCKYPFLHMLVLQGETNCGKSAIMEHMFKINGRDRYTGNIKMTDDQSKVAAILRTNWALGFGERVGITKEDNNVQKQFMDVLNSEISYQKKFQNEVTRYKPHNCVYVSTNDKKLLNDYTVYYNKRYWIIPCKITEAEWQEKDFWQETLRLKDQLWAEVKYKYLLEPDKKLILSKDELQELIEIQQQYQTIDSDDIDFTLDELLNKKFKYTWNPQTRLKTLESEEDFINQFKNTDNGPSAGVLNIFPAKYIMSWKKIKGHDSRMDRMINKRFEELGWKYVNARYNGCQTKCWRYFGTEDDRNLFNGSLV